MGLSLPESLLGRLSERITAGTGLRFAPGRWGEFEQRIAAAAAEFGFHDAAACVEWLLSSPLTRDEIEILASHLTVGETYFFRDKWLFDALERHVLPGLIEARRGTDQRLRIWSAGCCTGEEPYSLAILLCQLIPDIRGWNILLLATDINRRFLQKAAGGRYGAWSFRATPPAFKERYFRPARSGEFEILPAYKSMVTFTYLNLMEDVYPSLLNNTNALDIILCRNVLMYFEPSCAARAVSKLRAALAPDGWLAVSPSEMSQELFHPLVCARIEGAMLYRKSAPAPFTPPPQPPAPLEIPVERVSTEGPAGDIPGPPQRSGGRAPARYEEAHALYEQGRYAEAMRALAPPLPEGDAEAPAKLRLLARICANQGKLEESLEWLERAIALDRLGPASYYLRALVLREQGNTAGALNSLRQTLYLDPDFLAARLALGDLAREQGNWAETTRHWRIALDLLERYAPGEPFPESDGITADRMRDILRAAVTQEAPA